MTRETHVEKYLRQRVRDAGGLCIKLSPASYVGIPDRLILLPKGVTVLPEVKKPKGGVIARMQFKWRDDLLALGHNHRFLLRHDDVDEMLNTFMGDR